MTDKQKSKAVIGAGTMGTGIAVSLARAGCDVLLFDKFNSNPEIKYRAEANILRFLAGMRNISRNEIASRIKLWDIDESEYLHQIIACDAIVEAIYENLDHKKKLYNQIRAISNFHDSAPIPIYSNTSTIQCSRLVEGLQDHEYFMVLHFFSPVPMSRVVEFVTHGGTNEETIRLGREMIEKMNKKVATAPDIPGFIVNRMLLPMLQTLGGQLDQLFQAGEGSDWVGFLDDIDKAFKEGTWSENERARAIVGSMIKSASRLLASDNSNDRLPPELEALAFAAGEKPDDLYSQPGVKLSEKEVDEMVVLATGFPAGPFELKRALKEKDLSGHQLKFRMGPGNLADFVGIDVAKDCLQMLKDQEPELWRVPVIFQKMVANRQLGIKSGQGFYSYEVMKEFCGNHATITIEGSVLSRSVIQRLKKEFENLQIRGAAGVILRLEKIRGADICEFPSVFGDHRHLKNLIQEWHELMTTIHNFPKPVIAVIRNSALGGGYELALACDYIVAEKRTKVGLPELRLGILPGGGGTQNLARRVGLPKSLWMILGGEIVEASTPWVDEVVDSATPDYLQNLLEKIGKKPRQAMRLTGNEWAEVSEAQCVCRDKWQGNEPNSFNLALDAICIGTQEDMAVGLKREMEAVLSAFETDDAKQGILYFLEHGKHKFQILASQE
ncbi:MAG: hypothetical protein A2831_00030 [Candidatus Yanofskybacteria bacterium RIFCSPHIGHO2_01_FULL_44_17]|uniref:Uncharacterized protein n=1 Tax=Candidatus Yanofskybacteria bacterium RIFCSPHIGHO2_01_FULL_44_17 TaxID=1802668 RepID=A0A1F8EVZ4_9BACT|nr:MAG: hypothetical protein A2831_00030 [Candidatus Yanofskybacteria bacterium RIFCSPHIGHO2_01_FULL_44_17]